MEIALQNALGFFINVLIEIIPLFLAVTFLAGLALEYIKPQIIREKLGGKKGITGILAATALGFVTPFCSCSTIPLLAGMMAAGIPIGVLTAFLFASPYPVEVGMIVLGPMFGWTFAAAFVATGAIIAAISGLLLQKLNWQNQIKDDFKGFAAKRGGNSGGNGSESSNYSEEKAPTLAGCNCQKTVELVTKKETTGCECGAEKSLPPCDCDGTDEQKSEEIGCGCRTIPENSLSSTSQTPMKDGFSQKSKRAALYSLTFFKRMFPFILLGCTMGAIIYGFVPEELLAVYMGGTSIFAVPIAALIGVPLYVSIIPIIPIVLSLSTKGVSSGAVIAFMITATSISPPELIMLSGMFKRRYIVLFIIMMIIGAIATGYVFNGMSL